MDLKVKLSILEAEVLSPKMLLNRAKDKLELHLERLIADTVSRFDLMLGWLPDRKIEPNILVFYKAGFTEGT